jgi:hypothetical protein
MCQARTPWKKARLNSRGIGNYERNSELHGLDGPDLYEAHPGHAGQRVLVLRGRELLEAVPGEWTPTRSILTNMFGEEQLPYFLSWIKLAVAGLYGPREERLYGQAVVLCGPPSCGKSLVQNRIITPLLGGRSASPLEWLTGQTSFNSELFEAVHLIIEDEYYLGG